MSTADIRIDDEIYNMVMAWVSNQPFAQKSRHFVANTNLNSRMWFLRDFSDDSDDDEEDDDEAGVDDDDDALIGVAMKKKAKDEKKVQFTPSFGTHYFWYRGRFLAFRRTQDRMQMGWNTASEREEITISSFGRNPAILKQLLDECKADFMKNDENRTVIYRGGLKPGSAEPQWTRCTSRVSRPFSTVVLDEKVKKELLTDMRDYLHPFTRRWYSNRGIPYRRGYLLHGPPGTGKSSLSFAIAGYFKLKIYIVSLNSPAMNEENLGTLFTDLPKQCVVLLEDIDTAGLTHTRRSGEKENPSAPGSPNAAAGTAPDETGNTGRISLSGLLNVLDGVASQEGRVLIMTTNHVENLDEALIRPGRVDMMIKFSLATSDMIFTIFRGIFATLEGDIPPAVLKKRKIEHAQSISAAASHLEKAKELVVNGHARKLSTGEQSIESEKDMERKAKEEEERIQNLGAEFASKIPDSTFSPAEIQGYLLKWKREPEKAVKGAEEWVKTLLEEKGKKKEKEAALAAAAAAKVEKEKKENGNKDGEKEDEVLTNEDHVDVDALKISGVKKRGTNKPLVNGVVHSEEDGNTA